MDFCLLRLRGFTPQGTQRFMTHNHNDVGLYVLGWGIRLHVYEWLRSNFWG